MLKTKDSPENIRAETSIKQQDAAGRLKDFRDWFYEKVSVGKRTELVFFFERHTFKDLELFKDWIKKNKPDVIALEEVGVEGFKKMLDGKISVEDYMERQKTSFPEFLKQRYEFLVKFHQQNRKVKIEQVGYPPELPMSPRVHLEADSFDGLIEALLFRQKMSAFDMDERDVGRASIIEDRIRRHQWRGTVFIEAGAAHTQVKNLLKGSFRGDKKVEISSIFPSKNLAEKEFGRGISEVYPQLHELERIYIYKKDPSNEKLLVARLLITSRMHDINTRDDKAQLKNYRAVKMADKLSYDECREIFGKIHDMNQDEAFTFVKGYLEKKAA